MKYETPELTALTPAINAIESTSGKPTTVTSFDSLTGVSNEHISTYADWE